MTNAANDWLDVSIDNTPILSAPQQLDAEDEPPLEEQEQEQEQEQERERLPIFSDSGAEKLVDAVMELMAHDYILDIRRLSKFPNDCLSASSIVQTEDFIRSRVFERLTKGETDPEALIKKLRKAAFNPRYKPGYNG